MPRCSIIMPCFNHASFIGESIEAVLSQKFSDLELIVIDDCSRDNSREIIEKYARSDSRVRAICHESNHGVSRSRNDGLRIAKGEYIAFCDADDVWMPTKLVRQLELLENQRAYDAAYCDAEIIDGYGIETGERFSDKFPVPGKRSGRLFYSLCTRNFVNTQTVVLRRNCVEDVGYFDENINFGEDWWFWLRISDRHLFVYTDEVLAKYRVHERSTAVIERRGYKSDRIKVFHRILRAFPEIPVKLKAEIYYHIGVALTDLGKRTYARRCFIRSMEFQRSNLRAFCRLLLSTSIAPFRQSLSRPAD
jgi:glycosyltransferase involved in cell wall biosynthesis